MDVSISTKLVVWLGVSGWPGLPGPLLSVRGVEGAAALFANFATVAETSLKLGWDEPPNGRITSPYLQVATRRGEEQFAPAASHIRTS